MNALGTPPVIVLAVCLILACLYIWRILRVVRRLRERVAWYREQSLGHIERTIEVEEAKWIAAFERLAAKKREVRASLEGYETQEAETD